MVCWRVDWEMSGNLFTLWDGRSCLIQAEFCESVFVWRLSRDIEILGWGFDLRRVRWRLHPDESLVVISIQESLP